MEDRRKSPLAADLTALDWLSSVSLKFASIEIEGSSPRCTSVKKARKSTKNKSMSWRETSPASVASDEDMSDALPSDLPYQTIVDTWPSDCQYKPAVPIACLIAMAIRDSRLGKLSATDIYTWIRTRFAFYRKKDSQGWKVFPTP